VTDARRCTGFTQKAKSRRFVTQISFADYLQSYQTPKIDVERFVRDAQWHRDPTRPVSRLRLSPIHNARIAALAGAVSA
jgi:hypothetical protein